MHQTASVCDDRMDKIRRVIGHAENPANFTLTQVVRDFGTDVIAMSWSIKNQILATPKSGISVVNRKRSDTSKGLRVREKSLQKHAYAMVSVDLDRRDK